MVPTHQDFAYYFDIVVRDDGGAQAIWLIAITDYVVLEPLGFVGTALDGAAGVTCIDPRNEQQCQSCPCPIDLWHSLCSR